MCALYIPLFEDFEYAYANGRIWALENRLLRKESLLRMVETESLEDAVRILEGTGYEGHIKNLDVDEALEKIVQEFYALLGSFLPDKRFLKPFIIRYEMFNKEVFSKIKKEEIEDRIIEFDRRILNVRLELALKIKGLLSVVTPEIDIYNLKVFLRANKIGKPAFFERAFFAGGDIGKEVFLSSEPQGLSSAFERIYGEKYKSLPGLYESEPSFFDRDCDNLVLEKARDLSKGLLGSESAASYIYEKEMEIKNLGIILKAKALGIDNDEVASIIRG